MFSPEALSKLSPFRSFYSSGFCQGHTEVQIPSAKQTILNLPRLRYAYLAASLGALETAAGPPTTNGHVESTSEERSLHGIPEALIRYAVAIEDVKAGVGRP